MVNDSASIRIAESRRAVWSNGEEWSLSPAPVLSIGVREGREEEQLFRVRDAARLSDGRIIVVNAGTHELRVYSAQGMYLRTIGGKGPGPGEFNDPSRVWVTTGDTLVVVDWSRITVLDSSGAFVRSATYGLSALHDRFEDNSYLRLPVPRDAFLPGYARLEVAVVRDGLDGHADTLARLPGDEVYRIEVGGGVSSYPAPFGLKRVVAVHGDSIYTGDGARWELWDLDETGRLARILRWQGHIQPMTSAVIDTFENTLLARTQTERQRQRLHQLFRQWEYPNTQPVYDQLLAAGDGHIWVRHFSPGPPKGKWSVLEPSGRWLGVATVPPSVNLLEVGPDYVLATMQDDVGVEYVQMFTLRR